MYCLALAMERTGVHLHAACVMSNHHHLVVTDPRGLLPDFLRELHRLTAKALNASQGQWENLWAAEPCNVVRLVTDEDVEEKIAYVSANPVTAGLVRHPEEWPGFSAWGGDSFEVQRPSSYFIEGGICAPFLELRLTRPSSLDGAVRSDAAWAGRIERAIARKVVAAHEAVRRSGRVFLGRAAVLASSFRRQAPSYEQKRKVAPTFAAIRGAVREGLRRMERGFRSAYRRALEQWREGRPMVEFPFGTWGMRNVPGILIAES
jgi:REP element-mobilizing transposase RayT